MHKHVRVVLLAGMLSRIIKYAIKEKLKAENEFGKMKRVELIKRMLQEVILNSAQRAEIYQKVRSLSK